MANDECMPLSEKWVITLSTQYGCPMKCSFCDVPNIPFKGNVSMDDLFSQLYKAISLFNVSYTERLNIHFARMGDPIFNDNVFLFASELSTKEYKQKLQIRTGLRIEVIHPVLTTSCPKKYKNLKDRLFRWAFIKNHLYRGQAGLQLSINSTNDKQRDEMFNGQQIGLNDLANMVYNLPHPVGRKYCLNFAYSNDFEINAEKLKNLFNPDCFMVKITPIHNNNACRKNNIKTIGGYESYSSYESIEKDLKNVGFDVLVFIPSLDEENGLVTCGNAILGGGEIKSNNIIRIQGQ